MYKLLVKLYGGKEGEEKKEDKGFEYLHHAFDVLDDYTSRVVPKLEILNDTFKQAIRKGAFDSDVFLPDKLLELER